MISVCHCIQQDRDAPCCLRGRTQGRKEDLPLLKESHLMMSIWIFLILDLGSWKVKKKNLIRNTGENEWFQLWFPVSPSSVCQNVTANHRVNDAVFSEDGAQMVTGRFMYGPLDMVTLTGEKVITLSAVMNQKKTSYIIMSPSVSLRSFSNVSC